MDTLRRLQSIFILRKLTIPLDKIKIILNDNNTRNAVEVLNEKLSKIDDELVALETIKSIIQQFLLMLNANLQINIDTHLLSEYSLEIIDSITSLNEINKEQRNMSDLNKASETLNKFDNIRIVYLPPATIASSHCGICDEPERISSQRLENFIKETDLCSLNPGFKQYGFNNSYEEDGRHGYEFWVTIPEDLNVKPPITKKTFKGGLYAAHCIKMGDFREWQPFYEAVLSSKEYDPDPREPLGMDGALEEHLNASTHYINEATDFAQLDLLIPIKKK